MLLLVLVSLSGSMVMTMGAPADRLVVPLITGVVSLARLSTSMVTVGAAAAPVVLNGWVMESPTLLRPVAVAVATLLATLSAIFPLLLLGGETTRVYTAPLPENIPFVPMS